MYVLHRGSSGAVRRRTHPACLATQCDSLDGLRLRGRTVWPVFADGCSSARVRVAARSFAWVGRPFAAAGGRGRSDFGAAIPPGRQKFGPGRGSPGILDTCRRGAQRRDCHHRPDFCLALYLAEPMRDCVGRLTIMAHTAFDNNSPKLITDHLIIYLTAVEQHPAMIGFLDNQYSVGKDSDLARLAARIPRTIGFRRA